MGSPASLGGISQGYVLKSFITQLLRSYWERSPTAVKVLSLLQAFDGAAAPIYYDHLAFRTLQVGGLGIPSIAKVFLDYGYIQRDELVFPKKKIRAFWYAPPGNDPELPRIFISELKVDELSPGAQQVILKYANAAGNAGNHATFLAATGVSPWGAIEQEDFKELSKESEYAAWTLSNHYSLNHTTVSVHRMQECKGGIRALNDKLLSQGISLNTEGGVLKVSPDGGLLQSSTVADMVPITFASGVTDIVPGSYLEFAERLVLPQYQHLSDDEVREEHRRDGFEVGNADAIFASTTLAATTKQAA